MIHSVFLVDDTRHMIFEYLSPRDLAQLAQTSRSFFNIATDYLWKSLDSLRPFMCCLPPDLVGIRSRHRQLTLEDVSRLDLYSSKVQRVLIESETTGKAVDLPVPFAPVTSKMRRANRTKKSKRERRQNAKELLWMKMIEEQKKNVATGAEEEAKEENVEVEEEEQATQMSWDELWANISKLRPNAHFLPNLNHLRVSGISEDLLRPFFGISGSQLESVYIKYIFTVPGKSYIYSFLDQLQDTVKLGYLSVRDGESDLLPTKVIEQSPLEHLRLDPRIHTGRDGRPRFKQLPSQPAIFQKSTLQHLALGLTRSWCGPEVEAMTRRYLPALRSLMLNLRTFIPEVCESGCVNIGTHSWTCIRSTSEWYRHFPTERSHVVSDCGRKSPMVFLQSLDHPQLETLHIKFPRDASESMVLQVVRAAKSGCTLGNLRELDLACGGWFGFGRLSWARPAPLVESQCLWDAVTLLLPLPRLQVLRLTVRPDFLRRMDPNFYESIADGLPELQTLSLSYISFHNEREPRGLRSYENVPLSHVAAFCHGFPNLANFEMGFVGAFRLDEEPNLEWSCPTVKKLSIACWKFRANSHWVDTNRRLVLRNVEAFFPNSDLAASMRKSIDQDYARSYSGISLFAYM